MKDKYLPMLGQLGSEWYCNYIERSGYSLTGWTMAFLAYHNTEYWDERIARLLQIEDITNDEDLKIQIRERIQFEQENREYFESPPEKCRYELTASANGKFTEFGEYESHLAAIEHAASIGLDTISVRLAGSFLCFGSAIYSKGKLLQVSACGRKLQSTAAKVSRFEVSCGDCSLPNPFNTGDIVMYNNIYGVVDTLHPYKTGPVRVCFFNVCESSSSMISPCFLTPVKTADLPIHTPQIIKTAHRFLSGSQTVLGSLGELLKQYDKFKAKTKKPEESN